MTGEGGWGVGLAMVDGVGRRRAWQWNRSVSRARHVPRRGRGGVCAVATFVHKRVVHSLNERRARRRLRGFGGRFRMEGTAHRIWQTAQCTADARAVGVDVEHGMAEGGSHYGLLLRKEAPK